MKGTGSFITILLAFWLVWDAPLDIDGNKIDPSLIREYRVYVDGDLKATVGPQPAPTKCLDCPGVPVTGLGWGNKKSVTVEAVATTGEVSPLSDPLVRLQIQKGGDGLRVNEELQ